MNKFKKILCVVSVIVITVSFTMPVFAAQDDLLVGDPSYKVTSNTGNLTSDDVVSDPSLAGGNPFGDDSTNTSEEFTEETDAYDINVLDESQSQNIESAPLSEDGITQIADKINVNIKLDFGQEFLYDEDGNFIGYNIELENNKEQELVFDFPFVSLYLRDDNTGIESSFDYELYSYKKMTLVPSSYTITKVVFKEDKYEYEVDVNYSFNLKEASINSGTIDITAPLDISKVASDYIFYKDLPKPIRYLLKYIVPICIIIGLSIAYLVFKKIRKRDKFKVEKTPEEAKQVEKDNDFHI